MNLVKETYNSMSYEAMVQQLGEKAAKIVKKYAEAYKPPLQYNKLLKQGVPPIRVALAHAIRDEILEWPKGTRVQDLDHFVDKKDYYDDEAFVHGVYDLDDLPADILKDTEARSHWIKIAAEWVLSEPKLASAIGRASATQYKDSAQKQRYLHENWPGRLSDALYWATSAIRRTPVAQYKDSAQKQRYLHKNWPERLSDALQDRNKNFGLSGESLSLYSGSLYVRGFGLHEDSFTTRLLDKIAYSAINGICGMSLRMHLYNRYGHDVSFKEVYPHVGRDLNNEPYVEIRGERCNTIGRYKVALHNSDYEPQYLTLHEVKEIVNSPEIRKWYERELEKTNEKSQEQENEKEEYLEEDLDNGMSY